MRVSRLITVGISVIALAAGSIACQALWPEWSNLRESSYAVNAAKLAALCLRAATQISLERGPTNGALGTEAPLPPERRRPLEDARVATQAALDALTTELATSSPTDFADLTTSTGAVRQALAAARAEVDSLLQQPLAQRPNQALDHAVSSMIASIPHFAPGLNVLEASLAKAQPKLTNLIVAARIATEVRDSAGQLGSGLTAALSAKRSLTPAEIARLERVWGQIEAMHGFLKLTESKLNGVFGSERANADVERDFFGKALALVRNTVDISQSDPHQGPTPAELAAVFVPMMQSIIGLRDSLLDELTARVQALQSWRRVTLSLNVAVATVLMAAIAFVYWLIRVRVSLPLTGISHALHRMNAGDLSPPALPQERSDEIGAVTHALKQFRNTLIHNEERSGWERARVVVRERHAATIARLTEQFRESIEAMAGDMARASGALEGTANTMSTTATLTTNKVAEMTAATYSCTQAVQSIAQSVAELRDSVTNIRAKVQQSSSQTAAATLDARQMGMTVDRLKEAVDEIGLVANLIGAISQQTNLLSLNASIEAARAGKAGLGFSVVALEVKHLAGQTKQATETIGAHIVHIEAATAGAVEAIRGIVMSVGQIDSIAGTIAAAVDQQGHSIEEIAANAHQTANNAQAMMQDMTLVQAGSENTGTAAESVLMAAGRLSRQAAALSTEIDSYVLDVHSASHVGEQARSSEHRSPDLAATPSKRETASVARAMAG